jgi:hypothetical protein
MMFKNLSTLGLAGTLTVASTSALAAVPTEVTTAFTDLSADLVTVGGLVVVATVGVAVWKFVQAIII